MHRIRPLWIRDLRLYRTALEATAPWEIDEALGAGLHVRSRLRSASDPDAFALYCVRDAGAEPVPPMATETHTLAVVREFRRVPLDASTLALVLFTTRGGSAARVIATLAHWVERAVSAYQPGYLLLARSLEQPRISALLAAVHEGRALQRAWPSPFSLESLLPEVSPWLEAAPEYYVYCPDEARPRCLHTLSPDAV
jgi:hypothetical protein